MKKTILALSTVAVLGTVAYAGQWGDCSGKKDGENFKNQHRMMEKRGMPMMGAIKDLELTEDQKTKIYDLMKAKKEERQKSKMFQDRKAEFKSYFTKDSFNKSKFLEVQQKRSVNKAEMMESMYNILTKDQKEKLYNSLNK